MELAIKKDVFVLWVWLAGFGGLNGARRAIGLEDSNKDDDMGPKNPKGKLWVPKQGNLSQLFKSVSRQLEWRYHR